MPARETLARHTKHRLRRILPVAAVGLLWALTACTPQQARVWADWHRQDPAAAVAYARAGCPGTSGCRVEGGGGGGGSGGGGTVWDRLAQCESGGDWSINTGNGYYGGLQFLESTWRAYGGSGMPHHNGREEQIRIAERVRADVGWGAWPACTRRLGLR